MLRIAIASALLLGAGTIAGVPATSVVGRALAPAAQSREQAAVEIDDATAAALIGAIASQFDERSVQVRLGKVDLTPAGIVQRDVHGSGQLQIGRDPAWIPFRFRALYDTEQSTVGSPELTLGADRPSHALAANDTIAKALGKEAAKRLQREFAQQPTTLRLDAVRSTPAGTAYVELDADGVATLDGDYAATRVHALYDPRTGAWLQLAYALDQSPAPDAVATR